MLKTYGKLCLNKDGKVSKIVKFNFEARFNIKIMMNDLNGYLMFEFEEINTKQK